MSLPGHHPLFNPAAGSQRLGEPPPRYPNRAECLHAIRAGAAAALARLEEQPSAKPAHLANTAALVVLDARPLPTIDGVVRQAEMVMLCNWISARIRAMPAADVRGLLANLDALCEGAPLPME